MTMEKHNPIPAGGVQRDGGVQGPTTLGMAKGPSPQQPGKMARTQRTLRETEEALARSYDTLASEVEQRQDALAALDETRQHAEALWQALYVLLDAQRKGDGDEMDHALSSGGEVMLTLEPLYRPKPVMNDCPECVQGKHANCTDQAMNDLDAIVPCSCKGRKHDVEEIPQ